MFIYLLPITVLLLGMTTKVIAKENTNDKSSFNTGYGSKSDETYKKDYRQLSIGIGLNFPDIFPIETHWRFSDSLSLKFFLVPKVPFNIRVEMPSDQVSSKDGILIEHPDFNVNFKANYGPQYGVEAKYFPFLKNLYIFGGLNYRSLSLDGNVSSPLIIRSDITTGFETNSQFTIRAQSKTYQYIARAGLGFHWQLPNGSYIDLLLAGVTQPIRSKSSISVQTKIENPKAPTQREGDAINAFKTEKEKEMEEKALDELNPAENQVLPLIGVSFGISI